VKNVTQSAGNEAKKVLDTATDFSKNIAIVMHPETTKEQTREALLNIYTSLKGIKDDGRKRALSLLLSFFTSLEFPKEFIEEKIESWNVKNYHPLKEGYIRAQIDWHTKNKRMPPNYDKPIYKEFGIRGPPEPGIKNPINYTIKMAMRAKGRGEEEKKDGK